jgi:SEC-C motif
MSSKKLSRNDPCPCGSGKKYKHCCYRTRDEGDLDFGASPQPPKYPIGTVALYGPDEKRTTKIAAAVIVQDGAEPIMMRWVASDVTTNPKVQREMKDFFQQNGVKSVAMSQGNMGCPHEEGEDFPQGEDCPFCPFWKGKQGSNRRD